MKQYLDVVSSKANYQAAVAVLPGVVVTQGAGEICGCTKETAQAAAKGDTAVAVGGVKTLQADQVGAAGSGCCIVQ
jgi:hypothetical protein